MDKLLAVAFVGILVFGGLLLADTKIDSKNTAAELNARCQVIWGQEGPYLLSRCNAGDDYATLKAMVPHQREVMEAMERDVRLQFEEQQQKQRDRH